MKNNLLLSRTHLLVLCLAVMLCAVSSHAGVALKLFYDAGFGITGTAVTNFTTDPSFPSGPTLYEVLANGLSITQNSGNNFGDWTRGFFEAPQTGQYTFWIASDDEGQLWLSTDENPANLVMIADNTNAVGFGAFSSVNQSPTISLVAGNKYYFEMFHKQGTGASHCEVACSFPDGSYESVLSGNHLWPYPVDWADNIDYAPETKAPAVLTSYDGVTVTNLQPTTFVVNGRPLDLTITAEATQPAFVQWYSNNVPVANGNLLNYHIPRIFPSHDGAVYSVIVSNSLGTDTASTTISVQPDTTPPTLLDALVLGNPAGDVSVVFSEGIDPVTGAVPGNYSINGATILSAAVGPDNATVLLRVTGMTNGGGYSVTVNNVQDLAGNSIAANSSVGIERGLITAYHMDETGGTVATDFSGTGKNGTYMPGAQPGFAGKVASAVKFDGVSGHIALPNGYSDVTSGVTVAVWANPSTSLTSWARFVDLGNGPNSDNILFARNGVSSDLTFEVRIGAPTAGQITATGAIALNQWQHFAATMDNFGNVVLYKNGVAVASGTLTGVPNIVNRTNCYIGRSDFPQDGYFQGKMDDFRIYNRALSPDAIRALASGGGPDDTAPVPTVSVVATTPVTAEKAAPPGVFTITRQGSTTSALTVQYSLGGSATNGVNYTSLSGTVVIPAGVTSVQVLVSPIDLSFSDVSRTVILTLTGSTNYLLGDPNSDTVTIQNNDVVPVAFLASADNAKGLAPTTVDVWFHAPVTTPSATNLANYSLSGGLVITSATLDTSHNLRVILGVSSPVPTNTTLSVSGVADAGGNSQAANIPVRVQLSAFNVIANIYHGPTAARNVAFGYVNDGIVNNVNNQPGGVVGNTGFDTFGGAANAVLTQFAGMLYPSAVDIQTVKVDLGKQFGDGGDWQAKPNLYILKNPVDTGSTRPESDTNDWVLVPAQLVSGSAAFQTAGFASPGPSPNTPYVFDLTGLTPAQRTGYGWAVGGVKANGANGFMSFSELRAYGVPGSNSVVFVQQPTNVSVIAGQRATFSATINTNLLFINYQWLRDGVAIPGATNAFYTTAQTTTADNNATFTLMASNADILLTTQTATLTVAPRTLPPNVVSSTMDLFGNIDVWFDEPVDPSTAQNLGNYSLNDPNIFLVGIAQDAYQLRITLNYSGTQSVSNLTLTVANVMDTFGNTMGTLTVPVMPQDWPVNNLVANQYHQGRATMLAALTNGVAQYGSTATTDNGDTWGGALGLTDFVGLIYSQPQVFGTVKVDLGYQFVDGGDWSSQPTLYVLKSPVDPSQSAPETNPNWVAVPATLVSGNAFSWEVDAPVGSAPANSPIAFDLSHLSLAQRTGYGWAVGGVPGNALATSKTGITPANEFLSISELRGFGVSPGSVQVTGAPQILLDVQPQSQTVPVGIPITLQAYAAGTQPISYQWKLNGANLTDNGRIIGSQSNVLTITSTLASDSGTYQLFMNNSAGANSSSTASLTVTRIAFNNGGGWSVNGGGAISSNVLTLTDGVGSEARSSFLNGPQYIGAFKAAFTYQDVGGGGADGSVFVLQNSPAGPSALGAPGGSLGYAGANPAMVPSVGVEFNIYAGNTNGVAYRTDAVTGTPYGPTGAVRTDSGDPIGVSIAYDGTTLSMTLTDSVANVSYTTNWITDIVGTLGTNTAYVGFTGASGGVASTQKISNFTFESLPALSFQQPVPGTLVISWPVAAGGFVLQQTSALGSGTWHNVTAPITQVNDMNQVTVSTQTGTAFYRLSLP